MSDAKQPDPDTTSAASDEAAMNQEDTYDAGVAESEAREEAEKLKAVPYERQKHEHPDAQAND